MRDLACGVAPIGLAAAVVVTLALPTEIRLDLGPLRLSAYRTVLLVAFAPAALRLLSGRAGRLVPADAMMTLFAVWAWICLTVNHGVATALESGGVFTLETLGAYLVGRTCILGAAHFRALCDVLLRVVTAVFVVSLPETLCGHRMVHETLGALLGGAPNIHVEPRFGLHRAFGPFDHPIANGVFGSSLVALGSARRGARGAFVATAAALTSLSSAAILATAMQFGLVFWRRATAAIAGRWLLLGILLALAYATVATISDRSGLQALMWYLTFDRETASYRLLIWEHGTANVTAHPWFGLGQADWVRPEWMSASIDSFWLQNSVTFGLPSTLLFAGALLHTLVRAGRAEFADPTDRSLRDAWIFAFVAIAFCGFTVHYWNSMFAMLGLLLGAGVWMGAQPEEGAA